MEPVELYDLCDGRVVLIINTKLESFISALLSKDHIARGIQSKLDENVFYKYGQATIRSLVMSFSSR